MTLTPDTGPGDHRHNNGEPDWRGEVDWPRVRAQVRWHVAYWGFGLVQLVLHWLDLLTGVVRIGFGTIDYAVWVVLLVMWGRIVPRGRRGGRPAGQVHGRTFLLLCGFIVSLGAYLVLLHWIGLGTVIMT